MSNQHVMPYDKREEQISTILDRFDFEKIHAYMTLVNWQYGGDGVPSVDTLDGTARFCLLNAANSHDRITTAGTGGFTATKMNGNLGLQFSIETARTF